MNEFVKKSGINLGIITGVVGILSATIIYIVDITLFANMMIGLTMGVVNIILGIVAVAKAKQAQGGFISFKDSLATFLLSMVIGSLLYTVFVWVLFNVIDPEAQKIVSEEYIRIAVEWMKKGGAKASEIKEKIKEIRAVDSSNPVNMIKPFFMGLLFYTVIGLIVAAAMKRNKESYT